MRLVPCTRIPRRQKPPLPGKLLHSMRLEPPARIPRKCQLSDLAVRWGCGPEGLSWAGSRSPPRTPAGGPEITPSPYHASFLPQYATKLRHTQIAEAKTVFSPENAPQYASHTPCTHTAEAKTVFSRKTAPQYASRSQYTHTAELPEIYSTRRENTLSGRALSKRSRSTSSP